MKVSISIEIQDDTSLETINEMGITSQALHDMYNMAFGALLYECVHPDAKWEMLVCVTDNTKQGAGA